MQSAMGQQLIWGPGFESSESCLKEYIPMYSLKVV